MKLIIDIPEVYYEALSKTEEIISSQRSGKTLMSVIYSAVGNGTPLNSVIEDVKTEIQYLPKLYPYIDHINSYCETSDVLKILNKHISGVEKCNVKDLEEVSK